jgi:DNA-binding SARP family transcriptional activator
MTLLRVDLLGGFAVHGHGGRVCTLPAKKARALLAYLALPPGRPHTREKLTNLLWGDTPESLARQAFRQTLSRLRRALGEAGAALEDASDSVRLNPGLAWIDAVEFEAAASSGSRAGLERAVELYRGDFLDGLEVDEPPFEEWRIVERERLRELVLETLVRLLREQMAAGQAVPAIQTAMRTLALDPLQEAVHRALMQLLLGQGRRAAALQQYQACVVALQRELGAEPEEETRRLYREILRATRPAASVDAGPGRLAAARGAETALVGRGGELERLTKAVARMLDEGGHVALITGEAGIGKSRLLQAFAACAAVRACWLSVGRCHETERALPFRPWIDALRGAGPALDPDVRERLDETSRAQLTALFPELRGSRDTGATPDAPPTLLFEPLLALVGALVSQQPVVLVIEDLHWADTMSARFLAFLGRRIHRWPVLVVGTTRPEDLVDAPALTQALAELRADGRLDEVVLGALSEAESRALVRALQPATRAGQDRERLEREIWSMSEGSPFVIVESVRGLQQGTPVGLGRGVRDFVAARLSRLGDVPRQCVAVASAIGRDFSFALLARGARLGEREAADAVEELVRRRVLGAVGDRLDFCHDRIRVVAYEQLLPARRALVHAAIGEALETLHRAQLDDVAGELGHHYLAAGDFGRAVPQLIRFGQLASYRYALDDAQRALAQARTAVERLLPSERDRWSLEIALHEAFVLSVLGRHREILELLRRHAAGLERVADGRLSCEYHFRLGLTHFFLGERPQARAAAGRALAEGERLGLTEAMGKALYVMALEAHDSGRPTAGVAYGTRAATLLDQPHTQVWLGLSHYVTAYSWVMVGDLDASAEARARVEDVGRRGGMPRLLGFAGFLEAWAYSARGDAVRASETARSVLEASRDPIVSALASGVLAGVHLEQGDARSALAILTSLVALLESRPIGSALVRNLALLAEAHLLDGHPAAARAAAARASQFLETAAPYNVGFVQRAWGRIHAAAGDREAAERSLSEALATFTASEARLEAAHTRRDLAALVAAAGDREAARGHVAAALAAYEKANAPRRVEATHARARSLGLL